MRNAAGELNIIKVFSELCLFFCCDRPHTPFPLRPTFIRPTPFYSNVSSPVGNKSR